MSNLNISIRSLLIPLTHDKLLLPNTSLAEIVVQTEVEPVEGPEWLLGMISWRGLRVPLVSFEAIQGDTAGKMVENSQIIVLNTLSNNSDLSFFAILAQGIPHLINANQSIVTAIGQDAGEENGVLQHVLVEAEPAIIPDLDKIESMIGAESSAMSS